MSRGPEVQLNGQPVSLAGVDPTEPLLRWLGRQGLKGAKEGCGDGDCGACSVVAIQVGPAGESRFRALNSCILPVGAVAGRELLTVEALAEGEALHPVQRALVEHSGSQCGYCTPGFVMSLFAGYYEEVWGDRCIEGNLCRCTGYRPIRAAAAALREVSRPWDAFRALLARPRAAPVEQNLPGFTSPSSLTAALAQKALEPRSAWIAGATDLGVALARGEPVAPAFIALDRVAELQGIEVGNERVRIGAAVTLSDLEARLSGMFPALDAMLARFAGRQVRNRATLGGNLGTASPAGDLLPVLLALDAEVECAGTRGRRRLPVGSFLLGTRKTALAEGELVAAVEVPRRPSRVSGAYKVAKRQTDDVAIASAAFAIERDAAGRVVHARLAFGAVAATARRAVLAENELLGRVLDPAAIARVRERIGEEVAPLDDLRASAAYRRALCGNLFAKFAAECLA